jgi:hypothetical protein
VRSVSMYSIYTSYFDLPIHDTHHKLANQGIDARALGDGGVLGVRLVLHSLPHELSRALRAISFGEPVGADGRGVVVDCSSAGPERDGWQDDYFRGLLARVDQPAVFYILVDRTGPRIAAWTPRPRAAPSCCWCYILSVSLIPAPVLRSHHVASAKSCPSLQTVVLVPSRPPCTRSTNLQYSLRMTPLSSPGESMTPLADVYTLMPAASAFGMSRYMSRVDVGRGVIGCCESERAGAKWICCRAILDRPCSSAWMSAYTTRDRGIGDQSRHTEYIP